MTPFPAFNGMCPIETTGIPQDHSITSVFFMVTQKCQCKKPNRLTSASWWFFPLECNFPILAKSLAKSLFPYPHLQLTRWSFRTSWRGGHGQAFQLIWTPVMTSRESRQEVHCNLWELQAHARFWGHVKRLLLRQLCWSQGSWEKGAYAKHFYCWANQPWLTADLQENERIKLSLKNALALQILLSCQHMLRLAP